MSNFLSELEQTEALLKHPLVTRELSKAFAASLEWARKHAEELDGAGWTVQDFFRVGHLAFPYSGWGPGWIPHWSWDKCEVAISDRGNLEFTLHEAGGDVVQTYWLHKHFVA